MTMSVNTISLGLFIVSATALLGSPGPGIASLLAVGRTAGLVKGLTYYLGMQAGLAIAAGFCAVGLFSLLDLIPDALDVMAAMAAAYLLYLAYRIASAPVGVAITDGRFTSSFSAGLLLGLANPKAFIAFVSLFASQTIMTGDQRADATVKWLLVIVIMVVVDFIWLSVGTVLRRVSMRPGTERALNLTLGALIVAATLLAFL